VSPLTIYLARLFGVAGVLMFLALVARPKASIETIQAMTRSPGLILITGIFTLIAGAAIVVGHNQWSGGALTVAVTALGWVTLIKGFALTALPASALQRLYRVMRYPQSFRLVMAIAAIFFAWLAWAAFTAAPAPGA
jgi:hypothetical protein